MNLEDIQITVTEKDGKNDSKEIIEFLVSLGSSRNGYSGGSDLPIRFSYHVQEGRIQYDSQDDLSRKHPLTLTQAKELFMKKPHNFPDLGPSQYIYVTDKFSETQKKRLWEALPGSGLTLSPDSQIWLLRGKSQPKFVAGGKSLTTLFHVDREDIKVSPEEFINYVLGRGKELHKPVTIELNSNYTAIVTKDKITVGCQEFSHEVLKKLYKASKQVSKESKE